MGLDMYLTKRFYVKNWDHIKPEDRYDITVKKGGVPVDFGEISEVITNVGYWRKANAVHQWFVINVQGGEDNCRDAYVTEEDLQDLLQVCEEVLANPEKAAELLPPQAGFFFGSTEIDEDYFSDLRDTVEICKSALDPSKPEGDFYYRASW